MRNLLDLPFDILYLVVEHLELRDLLDFCASCQGLRRVFRPDKFIWLLKNSEAGKEGRDEAVRECSYILRCHALSELFFRNGPDYDYDGLFRHGASFKPIPHGHLIEGTLSMTGPNQPGEKLDFLLDHGACLDRVDGGVSQLLEDAISEHGPCQLMEYLFQHGATLREVPLGLETLVDQLVAEGDRWDTVWFIIENGGPLRYTTPIVKGKFLGLYQSEGLSHRVKCLLGNVPDALNILLEDAVLRNGFSPEAETLLREGGAFHQVKSTAITEGDHGLLTRALLQDGVDLAMADGHGWTPLYRAAGLGCTEIVKALIKKGAPLNEGDEDRRTPLHIAASRGMHEAIAVLLDAGADPTIANKSMGTRPLHIAAFYNHLEAIKVLTQYAGQELDAPSKVGWSALFFACLESSTDIVRVLLDAGADPYFRNHDGLTPIHAAASGGHIETVTLLVNRGIDPGTASVPTGVTPLHCAADCGALGAVKTLIAHGANLTTTTDDGQNALHMAAAQGHLDVVQFLRGSNVEESTGSGDGRTALHWACQLGQLDVVKMLIELHADPTGQDKAMMTPLMLAAGNDHCDVMQFLIDQGVDPDAANSEGRTPLWMAATTGHAKVLQLLIDNHARVNLETSDLTWPLAMATFYDHLDVARILADNHANVNARIPDGLTALHTACALGNIQMVQVLVDYGADVNAGSTDGVTPLQAAALNSFVDIMQYLLQHQADVNQTGRGKTPLHVAATDGDPSEVNRLHAVETLIEYNADLSAKDDNGFTPLSCASRAGELGVVKAFVKKLGSAVNNPAHLDNFHRTPLHWAVYRRHPHVARFLVDAGMDTTIVDGYGQTALDWAKLDQALFHDIFDAGHQPTPENMRFQTLRQSVKELSQHLLEGEQKSISAGFRELGHCLAFLGDSSSAQFSFRQQLAALTEGDEPMHRGECQNATCPREAETGVPGQGQFVCSTCPDVILCTPCFEPKLSEKAPECCGHEFIEIPLPSYEDRRGWEVTARLPMNVQEWLKTLVTRYGHGNPLVILESQPREGR